MPVSPKKFAIAAAGAAVLATVVAAQPVAAAGTAQMAFYSGAYGTGTETIIDLDLSGQCHDLDTPAHSAINLSDATVEVYLDTDCRPGVPGTPRDDLYFVLQAHYSGVFAYPALSYRVRV